MTTIYCDDAGFTGDRLLDADQPFFGYSAIAIEPDAAMALVQEFRRRFDIVGPEISGRGIYRRPDALEAITWLFEKLGERACVVVNDKLFSLACKFFEYVYEPGIARSSSFFYDRGFHIHVASILWSHLRFGGDVAAARIASRFEKVLRRRSADDAAAFEDYGGTDAIGVINRFATACRPQIEVELAGLSDERGRIRWALDLSLSSAMSVLRIMGQRFGQLDVTFDESKPLEEYRRLFDDMVGVSEIPYMTFRGRTSPLVVNLVRPVAFGRSVDMPGLQIADVVASVSALAARDRFTPRGKAILQACLPWFGDDSVWPDIDALRLERKENFLNAVLMIELTKRAERGDDLVEGISAFTAEMSKQLEAAPPSFLLQGS